MRAELFADRARIAEAVSRVAAEIDAELGDKRPVLIGVLKGSLPFLADLARACQSELEIDLLAISQFGVEAKQGGVVRILKDLDTDIQGRHVVLVEDIVDTGLTLGYLLRLLSARGPASLRVATLLDRRSQRSDGPPVEHVALTAPDSFLVGYGLDHSGIFRNLRNLWLLNEVPHDLDPRDVEELHKADAAL